MAIWRFTLVMWRCGDLAMNPSSRDRKERVYSRWVMVIGRLNQPAATVRGGIKRA